ncbi:hypothetical protein BU26DRAFT_178077 [Trematosphaeria pertusa]|uniref:Uncharacterized protein n=1 Tax=Trematosphaeria pertusa TaxID=390896 RepID=A0A6A6HUK3_9PLEO|nr:uncharacterized protein BU26DRAFT_178077 [Trematosphaeria pertusa]KAF2241438.1 hypothetical protein BU26DRAFT_178077 [Trematosphaeria pertusa]
MSPTQPPSSISLSVCVLMRLLSHSHRPLWPSEGRIDHSNPYLHHRPRAHRFLFSKSRNELHLSTGFSPPPVPWRYRHDTRTTIPCCTTHDVSFECALRRQHSHAERSQGQGVVSPPFLSRRISELRGEARTAVKEAGPATSLK